MEGKKAQRPKALNHDLLSVIKGFDKRRVCVIGDIIADIYIFGKPYRLSREAPVVVVRYEGERLYPGSAGNTINNLLSLGAKVFPIGIIGKDGPGDRLVDYLLSYKNADLMGIIRYPGSTVTKTRIMAGDRHTSKQQVIRIDRDDGYRLKPHHKREIIKRLKDLSDKVDAFIVSDYGHGTVDEEVIAFMQDIAKKRIVVGDSRYNLKRFKGFTMITPNESEAYALASMEEGTPVEEVGRMLIKEMDVQSMLITRGNQGMSLFLKDGGIYHIPISGTDEVTDVTGAGDTVCAAVTLSLASGTDFYTASRIANYAAGVVVMKRGTATVTEEELERVIRENGRDNS